MLDYLEYNAAPGTKTRRFSTWPAPCCSAATHVEEARSPVLSGGERARLCLAGLLLSQYNVLVLDEPGNHLDVDTVEALAEALLEYKGTVVFTSHDRHFMKRVATCIVEVRDGRVTNYRGQYDAYLYAVNKEIDDGERERANRARHEPPQAVQTTAKSKRLRLRRRERAGSCARKSTNLERTIARLDEQKRQTNDQLLQPPIPPKHCGCTTK